MKQIRVSDEVYHEFMQVHGESEKFPADYRIKCLINAWNALDNGRRLFIEREVTKLMPKVLPGQD